MNRVRNGRAVVAATAPAGALLVGVVAGVLAVAAPAAAQDEDRAAAQALVQQLDHDAAHHAVTAEALAQAKDALERATRLRTAGDEAHALTADGLAREWAETARDLVRASDAEAKASELRRKAMDAQAQLERSRALVEEGIARVGRLRAEIEEAERQDRTAVEAHAGETPPAARPKPKNGGKAASKHGKPTASGGKP